MSTSYIKKAVFFLGTQGDSRILTFEMALVTVTRPFGVVLNNEINSKLREVLVVWMKWNKMPESEER